MNAGTLTLIRLALVVPGGSYDVRFKSGVDIIAGPISTGKSSILQLIDYAFGAPRRPTYEEIAECSDVLLECLIAGEVLTVRRSLHSQNTKARLYEGTIDEILSQGTEGREVWAAYHPSEPTVSREVLHRLGLADIDMKTAPTQAASTVNVFSLRDLMHFIYVDQDRIDSQRNAFYEREAHIAIKWRATLDIFAGLHDQAQTAMSLSLQTAQTEHGRLVQYLANVRDFLRKAKLPEAPDLRARLEALATEHEQLLARRQLAHHATEEKLGERLELVKARDDVAARIAQDEARSDELIRTITQLSRLRIQYDREKSQLEFLSECQRLVGSLPVSRCPSCLQTIEATATAESCYVCHQTMPAASEEPISIEPRIAAVTRRSRDLDRYIVDLGNEQQELKRLAAESRRDLDRLETTIERVASVATVPEMRRVMELDAAINAIESGQRTAGEQLEFWGQVERARENLSAVEARVAQLRTELERLQRDRPSKDAIVADLSALFASILSRVKFPALRDVRVDAHSYVPVVRGQHYGELSSRGAIALAVTGWHLAVLRYFAAHPGLFPGLMILDSPLSNVGHDAADHEFRDQQIVNAFYVVLADLDARLKRTQLLICDNRPPSGTDSMVIVRFTGDETKGRVGLVGKEPKPAEVASEQSLAAGAESGLQITPDSTDESSTLGKRTTSHSTESAMSRSAAHKVTCLGGRAVPTNRGM